MSAAAATEALHKATKALYTSYNDVRPETVAETENPNQKSDLEISNRIIPDEDFLKLEGNIFLD